MTDVPAGGVTVVAKQMASAELGKRKSQYTTEIAVQDSSGKVLGDLTISRGGIDWRSRYQQEPIKHNWQSFIDRMES